MTDDQLVIISHDAQSLTPTAQKFLYDEIRSRNISKTIPIHNEILIKEAENIILPQYNRNLLEMLINDFRDGKAHEEILADLVDNEWEPGKAELLLEAIPAEIHKRFARSANTITMGIFIFLAGIAVHLINPFHLDISPAGVLANCALLVGALKILQGLTSRRKYSVVIANMKK